jgi:hypothetical protein
MPTVIIDAGGCAKMIYSESVRLDALGRIAIRRASHVEPDVDGRWNADLAPVGGPVLGPFDLRSEALAAETHWLDERLANLPLD